LGPASLYILHMKRALANLAKASSRYAVALAIAALFATASSLAQTADIDLAKDRGTVIPTVTCLADAKQSYALYLPSNYTPDRRWPVIYAFDPFARGKVPVELYKDAAEKFGYIVVGSNNARNGPGTEEMAAAEADWADTHRRLMIDKDRVYTTGLSGGARFATSFALYCYTCSIAGVIAHGATYPVKEGIPANHHFLYYVAIGDQDFNYPEVAALREKKEANRAEFKVKVYAGPHQWAPPDVVEDAIEWLELKAMQAGRKKPDAAFIQQQLAKTRAEALQAEHKGDALTNFYAVRSLAFDFKGLVDVSRFQEELEALKKSKALKQARREENQQIDKQNSITASASADIAQLGQIGPEQVSVAKQRVISVFSDLHRQAKSDSRNHDVYVRAINELYIQGIEDGQQEFRNREFPHAADYFELMADAVPDQSWPLLLLAETRMRMGNRKAALKALQEAAKRGIKSPDSLTKDPELAPLASEPAFQKIVQSISAKSVP
jgi:dienelactone hydrolase